MSDGRRDAAVKAKHSHYYKDVTGLDFVDVYRVLRLFSVTDPCVQHAVKKLLVAGGRGAGKDITKDIQEAIDSLTRWQEMSKEDAEPTIEYSGIRQPFPPLSEPPRVAKMYQVRYEGQGTVKILQQLNQGVIVLSTPGLFQIRDYTMEGALQRIVEFAGQAGYTVTTYDFSVQLIAGSLPSEA